MSALQEIARRLSLGVALIVACAAVLLLTDSGCRRGPEPPAAEDAADGDAPSPTASAAPAAPGPTKRVAVVTFSSMLTLEEGRRGVLDGLAEEGYREGEKLEVKVFNPELDRTVAAAMAQEVVSGDYDLIVTLSTVMLQTVAAANREHGKPHVFCLSSDPFAAGVGVSRETPTEHPPYMAGYGSMQPIPELFRLAREANPNLKRVGVVWNSAEANSEACTKLARTVCGELGIELAEVNVDSSAGVSEAARSLTSRGVEAIWTGGDVTVGGAVESLIAVAREAGIPVFSNMPTDTHKGVYFSLGADYHEVGRLSGRLAGEILKGRSTEGFEVVNLLPTQFVLNPAAAEGLDPAWKLPQEWFEREGVIVVPEK